MICVIASVHVKPGRMTDFLPILKANVPTVRKERGCREYMPAVDVESGLPPQVQHADMVTILEKWDSLDDLRTHLASAHMATYHQQVKELVEKVTVQVLQEA